MYTIQQLQHSGIITINKHIAQALRIHYDTMPCTIHRWLYMHTTVNQPTSLLLCPGGVATGEGCGVGEVVPAAAPGLPHWPLPPSHPLLSWPAGRQGAASHTPHPHPPPHSTPHTVTPHPYPTPHTVTHPLTPHPTPSPTPSLHTPHPHPPPHSTPHTVTPHPYPTCWHG